MNMTRRVVPLKLSLNDYEYPSDREGRSQLNKQREIQNMVRDYIKEYAEPYLNGQLNGMGVKVSSRQLPELYGLVKELASILDIITPQIFIQQDPYLKASTYGTEEQNTIIISHSLYEQFNESQLAFILGHEMGHIKSQHVFYLNMFNYIKNNNTGNLFTRPMQMEILKWQRSTEVTADRAGLICCQDIDDVSLALLTLAAGSIRLAEKIDLEEYIESQLLSLEYNPVGQFSEANSTHNYIPIRLRHLREFYHSKQYRTLVEADIELNSTNEISLDIKLSKEEVL